jgi:hypothetical protein
MTAYSKKGFVDNIHFLSPEIKLTILLAGGLNLFKQNEEYNLSWVRRKDLDAAKVWTQGSLVKFKSGEKQKAQKEYFDFVFGLMVKALKESDTKFEKSFYRGIAVSLIDGKVLNSFSTDEVLNFIRKHHDTHLHLVDYKTVNRLSWWMVTSLMSDIPQLKPALSIFNWSTPKRMDLDVLISALFKLPDLFDNFSFSDRFIEECGLRLNKPIYFITQILHHLRKRNLVRGGEIPHNKTELFLRYARNCKSLDSESLKYVENIFSSCISEDIFNLIKKIHDSFRLKLPVFTESK